jgi:hypothetical protein
MTNDRGNYEKVAFFFKKIWNYLKKPNGGV